LSGYRLDLVAAISAVAAVIDGAFVVFANMAHKCRVRDAKNAG
jgi:hypothetical protein